MGEHARVAIPILSGDIPSKRVRAHTGWYFDGDRWLYLHAGGAIGAEGLIDVVVELPQQLAPAELPAPPAGDELRHCLRAVTLDLPKAAPESITLPAIGCALAAVLGGADFSGFLSGRTGNGKSE